MGDTSDGSEINRLSRLGGRDDPNLEVTPISEARGAEVVGAEDRRDWRRRATASTNPAP